jgi:hypothetical protein
MGLNNLQRRMAHGHDRKITIGIYCFEIDWGDYQKHHWNQMSNKIAKISAEMLLICTNGMQYREQSLLAHSSIAISCLLPQPYPSGRKLAISHSANNFINSVECIIKNNWPQLKELDLSNLGII